MTSAGNFAMLGGVRSVPSLPYDAEVEYLESTGTQWIDTGIKPNYDDVVRIELAVGTSSSLGRRFLFSDGNPNVAHYVEINGDNKYGVNNSRVIPVSFTVGNLYKAYAEFSGTLAKLGATINNSDYETSDTNYASPDWRDSLRLFRIDGTYAGSGSRIGRLSIKINGDIVFNSRPVRFTNEQGVSEGAMYDRIGVGGMNPDGSPRNDGLYRNRGTGSFTIGPDIGSYVETDGKCWYNTGLYLRTPLIIECDYYLPERGPGQSVWGAVVKSDARIQQQSSTSTTRREITFSYNDSHILVGSSDARPYYPYRAKAVFDVREGYQKVTTDFAEATASIELGLGESMTAPCCLFAYGRTNSPAIGFAPSKSRIYSWKCSMGGVLVADAIPSLGPDGSTPCFYDKVSKTYWYNMGTGTPKAVIV